MKYPPLADAVARAAQERIDRDILQRGNDLARLRQASARQVGGNHYAKHTIQPWHIIEEYRLDFWLGNVVKYVLRHEAKGGVEDLKKARHYLDYVIEQREQATGPDQPDSKNGPSVADTCVYMGDVPVND